MFFRYSRPIFIAFYLFFVLVFLYGLYGLFFEHVIRVVILLEPILVAVLFVWLYKKNIKMQLKREAEMNSGRSNEVLSAFTEESFTQTHTNGLCLEIPYSAIKIAYRTESYILLMSESRTCYTVKKDGFLIGCADDFLKFLANKGVKIHG